MKPTALLITFLGTLLLATGCYYDNEEDLYPQTACDTANITFSATVYPIFQSSCSQCHNNVSPSASIDLSSYDGIVAAVNTGRLLGAINQESGFSPMPKNSDKLSACFISQISIWINNGMPNN